MKRLLIILIVLFISSCSLFEKSIDKQLEEIGYSEQEISFIINLDEERINLLLQEYNPTYLKLMMNDNYLDDNFDLYVKYYGLFDDDMLIDLVNRNIINDANKNLLKELYSSEYYIASKEELYLEYLAKYDSVRKVIEAVNTNCYRDFYSEIKENDISKDYLMIVNKYYRLPDNYEAKDLINVPERLGSGKLRQEVVENLSILHDDALELGYNIKVVSAYRSYDYQAGLYNKYLSREAQEFVDTYSARPGHSEHQTGLCVDVSVPGYSLLDFHLTDASKWLTENCHKYGFIVRYPEDKVEVTGYIWEPWHIRYVGKQVASQIYEMGITFDEYYACFVEGYE